MDFIVRTLKEKQQTDKGKPQKKVILLVARPLRFSLPPPLELSGHILFGNGQAPLLLVIIFLF